MGNLLGAGEWEVFGVRSRSGDGDMIQSFRPTVHGGHGDRSSVVFQNPKRSIRRGSSYVSCLLMSCAEQAPAAEK